MPRFLENTNAIYIPWTVLTFVTSLLVLFFALFGLVWGGFRVWQVNLTALIAVFSSAGLLFGVVRSKSNRISAFVVPLLSALPLPALVIVLLALILLSPGTDKSRLGSVEWWAAFSIYGVQVFLGSIKIYQFNK